MNFKKPLWRRAAAFLASLPRWLISHPKSAGAFTLFVLCLAGASALISIHEKGGIKSFIFHANPASKYSIPSPPVLSLPPPAHISTATPFLKLAPKETESAPLKFSPVKLIKSINKKVKSTSPKLTPPQKPPLTIWQIIQKYNQVIVLSEKDYDIAVEMDQYGYKKEAVLYYKKYLYIAPNGSHATQIRSRLNQLESSF